MMEIMVSKRTLDDLNQLRQNDETYNEVIQRLIEKWEATEIPDDQLDAAIRMMEWRPPKK